MAVEITKKALSKSHQFFATKIQANNQIYGIIRWVWWAWGEFVNMQMNIHTLSEILNCIHNIAMYFLWWPQWVKRLQEDEELLTFVPPAKCRHFSYLGWSWSYHWGSREQSGGWPRWQWEPEEESSAYCWTDPGMWYSWHNEQHLEGWRWVRCCVNPEASAVACQPGFPRGMISSCSHPASAPADDEGPWRWSHWGWPGSCRASRGTPGGGAGGRPLLAPCGWLSFLSGAWLYPQGCSQEGESSLGHYTALSWWGKTRTSKDVTFFYFEKIWNLILMQDFDQPFFFHKISCHFFLAADLCIITVNTSTCSNSYVPSDCRDHSVVPLLEWCESTSGPFGVPVEFCHQFF